MRAESRIDLEWTDGDEPTLQGRIQDDLGRPLGNREVAVEFADKNDLRSDEQAVADPDGYFWIVRPPGLQPPVRVRARFDGDNNYESTYVTLESDRGSRKPQLDVRIGDPVDLSKPRVAIEVQLSWQEQSVRAPISIKNELGHRLAAQIVDGEAVIEVASKALGPPGDGRLIVESAKVGDWDSRRTETPIRRRIRPALTLESRDAKEGERRLCGALQDDFGALPDRIVELHQSTQRIATLRTGSKGEFCTTRTPDLDEPAEFVATFAGDGRGRWPTESAPLQLRASKAKSGMAWVGPLVTLLIGLVAWVILSRRADKDATFESDQKPVKAGVRTAKPMHARADQFGLTLRVFALDSGQPLADAQVELVNETSKQIVLRSDADGWVRVDTVERGVWALTIAQTPGYLTETSSLTVPHRGQWTHAQVFLQSVRQHADAVWTDLASDLSGREVQQLTQREIALALPELRKAGSLAREIELTTYASEPKNAQDLEALRKRADALRGQVEPALESPQLPEK